AGASVGELGYYFTGFCAEGTAARSGQSIQAKRGFILTFCAREAAMLFGQITIVDRLNRTAGVFLNVAPITNPVCAQRGQTLLDRAFESRIAPRSGTIVNTNRFILFRRAVKRFRR